MVSATQRLLRYSFTDIYHRGCVTPVQLERVIEQIGGLDGLDLDSDLDILDGWEELPEWAQTKVKNSLINGHVDDEDWKGVSHGCLISLPSLTHTFTQEPELNRPGMKGINKRTPKKKAADDESGEEAEEDSPSKSKKGSRKKKAAASDDEDDEPAPKKKKTAAKKRKAIDDDDDGEAEEAPPKKRATKGKKTAVPEDDEVNEAKPAKKKAARGKKAAVKDESEEEAAPEPPKKKARSRKVKAESDAEEADKSVVPQNDGSTEVDTKKAGKRSTGKKGSKRAAAANEDEGPQDKLETNPAKAEKTSRAKKAKTELTTEDAAEQEPAPKPTKASRSKKAKEEHVEEEEVLDATDKKKQAKKSRGKKANLVVPVPEDEQTSDVQPEGPDTAVTTAAIDEAEEKGKKKSRKGRAARRSDSKT